MLSGEPAGPLAAPAGPSPFQEPDHEEQSADARHDGHQRLYALEDRALTHLADVQSLDPSPSFLLGGLAPMLLFLLSRAVFGRLLFGSSAHDLVLQTLGELPHDLLRHVLLDTLAELGRPPGYLHVGLDAYPGAVAPVLLLQGGGDGGRSRSLPPGVLAVGPEYRPVLGLVGLLEPDLPLVVLRDGPELDPHRPFVLTVAGLLRELRPRQARGHPLQVEHHAPCLVHRRVYRKLVL